jgi:hypothetical protein
VRPDNCRIVVPSIKAFLTCSPFHHIHIHKTEGSGDTDQWDKLFSLLNLKFDQMATVLETLQAEVAENKTVMASAVTLLQGLKKRLDEAIGNEAALRQLSADLDTNTNDLAAAVTANTPSEGSGNGEGEDGDGQGEGNGEQQP